MLWWIQMRKEAPIMIQNRPNQHKKECLANPCNPLFNEPSNKTKTAHDAIVEINLLKLVYPSKFLLLLAFSLCLIPIKRVCDVIALHDVDFMLLRRSRSSRTWPFLFSVSFLFMLLHVSTHLADAQSCPGEREVDTIYEFDQAMFDELNMKVFKIFLNYPNS